MTCPRTCVITAVGVSAFVVLGVILYLTLKTLFTTKPKVILVQEAALAICKRLTEMDNYLRNKEEDRNERIDLWKKIIDLKNDSEKDDFFRRLLITIGYPEKDVDDVVLLLDNTTELGKIKVVFKDITKHYEKSTDGLVDASLTDVNNFDMQDYINDTDSAVNIPMHGVNCATKFPPKI